MGNVGDIKNVADGYAKNFLMPNKLADVANNKNVTLSKHLQEKEVRDAEKDLLATEKMADRLSSMALEIKGKINESGRLYAAITKSTIAQKLKELGIDVDKKQIDLDEPIKELGDYQIKINLDHGLEAELGINVID